MSQNDLAVLIFGMMIVAWQIGSVKDAIEELTKVLKNRK